MHLGANTDILFLKHSSEILLAYLLSEIKFPRVLIDDWSTEAYGSASASTSFPLFQLHSSKGKSYSECFVRKIKTAKKVPCMIFMKDS